MSESITKIVDDAMIARGKEIERLQAELEECNKTMSEKENDIKLLHSQLEMLTRCDYADCELSPIECVCQGCKNTQRLKEGE